MFLVGLFEREEGTDHKYGCISYPSGSKIPQLMIFLVVWGLVLWIFRGPLTKGIVTKLTENALNPKPPTQTIG